MSVTNFIPSVWTAGILQALNATLVYGNPAIINDDYEGEIRNAGDSVRINMIGNVTVKDYSRTSDIDAPEDLTDAQLTLNIDQGKYFNFSVQDVDRVQANADVRAEAEKQAAYGLQETMDAFIAAKYTEIAEDNFDGTDASPITGFNASATKAYDKLVDLGVILDDTRTPADGRWAILPPWYVGYLQKDSRFTGFGTAGNRSQLERGMPAADNGYVGEAAGFSIYKSTEVPNTAAAKYKIMAGHRRAWSKAEQILEIEGYRPERRFADAVKGLHVYGAKVLRPSNLACLIASDA